MSQVASGLHQALIDDFYHQAYQFRMLRPINRGLVPFGGRSIYIDPDTGHRIEHRYYDHVKNCARDHRIKMGYSIPFEWDAWFDEVYCKSCPQACHDVPDGAKEKAPGWLEMAANFTRSMVQWAKSGFKVVDYDEFKRRMSICAGAPVTDEQPAIPQCQHFGRFPFFGAVRCNKCGCSALALHILDKHCPINKW